MISLSPQEPPTYEPRYYQDCMCRLSIFTGLKFFDEYDNLQTLDPQLELPSRELLLGILYPEKPKPPSSISFRQLGSRGEHDTQKQLRLAYILSAYHIPRVAWCAPVPSKLSNSMAYGIRRLNVAFTLALQSLVKSPSSTY